MNTNKNTAKAPIILSGMHPCDNHNWVQTGNSAHCSNFCSAVRV